MRLEYRASKQTWRLATGRNIQRLLSVALLGALVTAAPGVRAADYRVETLVPPSPIHGVNGMAFDHAGRLIVSSLAGAEIYRIDVGSGETETLVGPPAGLGDGLAIGLDGTIAWTALPAGEIRALRPDGEVVVLATGIPLQRAFPIKDLYQAQRAALGNLSFHSINQFSTRRAGTR